MEIEFGSGRMRLRRSLHDGSAVANQAHGPLGGKGEEATAEYRNKRNKVSIDGLPTGWGEA